MPSRGQFGVIVGELGSTEADCTMLGQHAEDRFLTPASQPSHTYSSFASASES